MEHMIFNVDEIGEIGDRVRLVCGKTGIVRYLGSPTINIQIFRHIYDY